jgi:soluble P-type ATPase
MHQNQIDFKSYLKDKKVLALSDTGYPHKHIKDFCKELSESIVDVYVSPATTSGFLKVYMSFSGNKRAKILKDKNFLLFNKIKKEDYIIVVFFGSKITKETKMLTVLAQQLVVLNYNVITITEEGVDYDENSPIFWQ